VTHHLKSPTGCLNRI